MYHYFSMRKHSTQIGHIFENVPNLCRKGMGGQSYVPNLCRMLAYTYVQAFYTDWVHLQKMPKNFVYPICVECLHIPMCKLSTQIGYIFD